MCIAIVYIDTDGDARGRIFTDAGFTIVMAAKAPERSKNKLRGLCE